jgi:predicted nucleic acid-binding protein
MAEAPAASRQKLAVLDTNVLFHLAEQYAPAHNLVLRLVKRGFVPVVTQTVVQELGYAAQYDVRAKNQDLATTALTHMRQWGIQPFSLVPVGNGICDIITDVILNRKLLPDGERHDAYILIESSFGAAAMLVTWDTDLLEAPNDAINEVLRSFDLHPIQIVHPRIVLGY